MMCLWCWRRAPGGFGNAAAWVAALMAFMAGTAVSSSAEVPTLLPVPAITLYPGDSIASGMIVEKPFASSSPWIRSMAASRESVTGRIAKRTLPQGSPIPLDALRSEFVVVRGQPVTLVYQEGSLNITAAAVALQSGGKGEPVSVRNVETGRVIEGVVADHRLVFVESR